LSPAPDRTPLLWQYQQVVGKLVRAELWMKPLLKDRDKEGQAQE
jgi:hypothetical protein